VSEPRDKDPLSDRALHEFLSEAQEIIESLNRDLLALESQQSAVELGMSPSTSGGDGSIDPERLNNIYRAVHSLKGLSGLFNQADMSQLTHHLEDVLDALRLGRVMLSADLLDVLFNAVDLLTRMVQAGTTGNGPAAHELTHFIMALDRVAVRGGEGQGDELAQSGLDPGILAVLTEYEEHRLRENLSRRTSLYWIRAEFDKFTIDLALDDIRNQIKSFGEIITCVPTDCDDDSRMALEFLLGTRAATAQLEGALSPMNLKVRPVVPLRAGGRSAASLPEAPSAPPGSRGGAPDAGPVTPHRRAASTLPPSPGGPSPDDDFLISHTEQGRLTTSGLRPGEGSVARPRLPGAGGATGSGSGRIPGPLEVEMARRGATGGEPVHEPPPSGRPPVELAPLGEEERLTSLRSALQTVRVDIRKLDHLMNLVGELGILRASIQRSVEQMRRGLAPRPAWGQADANQAKPVEVVRQLQREGRGLERKLTELQSGILEVRMVPLGQLFEKLSRVVRRISRDLGKDIRFVVEGGDTELDKLIVEELSDPLMHIIRNGIDHGIEQPEVRLEAGKPPQGTLRLSAQQKGNHVLITISDDGAGLDEERIRLTAVERGLIDAEQVKALSRREVQNLIFLPGFSTKGVVSEVSGRGVGMDVVKTNIGKLSGIIDIKSELGVGTTLLITLPITLAIIPALIIAAGGETYAVPLNSVMESVAVSDRDVRTVSHREVISLRGATLPLLRLSQLFGLPPGPPGRRLFVVVVGVAQHRMGIVVDRLIGQQDIVIKSLGRVLSRVRGIAGATELGGQQTVLVLDVAGLVEEVLQGSGTSLLQMPRDRRDTRSEGAT
jgi:two-component system chemotaxis sensor kinase CheA